MKPLVITAIVFAVIGVYNFAWEYLPLFPALLTLATLTGLPIALLTAVIKRKGN